MGPDAEEILELMQKQDDMVEVLQTEMDVCKAELRSLAEYCRHKDEELEIAQNRESELLDELESLKAENLKLTKMSETAIQEEKEKGIGKKEDFDSVVEMTLRLKELEFELEREKMTAKSKKLDFEMKNSNFEQKINELEAEIQLRKSNELQSSSKIENLNKMVAEWKAKYEVSSTRKDEELMKLESQLEISVHRESQFEEHIRQLLEELTTTRQEKLVANSRVSALLEETASLRAKYLRLSKTSPPDPDKKEMQKLLNDQSHLIAALREETKLLARKLEHDSKEYRISIKSLKQEKKDLEERMQNLLRI